MSIVVTAGGEVEYPDSDGKRTAQHTLQSRWLALIYENLQALYRTTPGVFVAASNLIYPVRGDPRVRTGPGVYVASGRPKHDRGSWKVWNEGGVFPQVVFEVLSHKSRPGMMARKLLFYERFGAEEYYEFDPFRACLNAYRRGRRGRFRLVRNPAGLVSRRLGVRLDLSGADPAVFDPAGGRFLSFADLIALRDRGGAEYRNYLATSRQAAELVRLRDLCRAAGLDSDAPPA